MRYSQQMQPLANKSSRSTAAHSWRSSYAYCLQPAGCYARRQVEQAPSAV